MAKRRKSNPTITVSAEGFAKLADELVPSHASLLGDGFALSPSSRLWQRRDGSWAARFIYKSKTAKGVSLSIEHRVDFEESA